MTREQLIQEATNKGAKIEFSKSYCDTEMIGIRFKNKSTYHWFISWNDKPDARFYFYHSYSMNTGKTKRGMRHSMRINKSLNVYNYC